jgi:hypothetical protein
MVKLAEAHPSVGVVGAYVLEGDRVKCDGLPYPSTVVPGRELCRMLLLGRRDLYVFGTPTSTLFRSDLVRSRPKLYDENNIRSADQAACFDILQESDFGFVHQVLTFTRLHEESRTSFQQQMNTTHMGKLSILQKYGPVYLSRPEYEERLKKFEAVYYAFLGRSIVEGRAEKEFWGYHRDVFINLGLSLSRTRLIKAFLKEMYITLVTSYMLHPKNTLLGLVGFKPRSKHQAKLLDTNPVRN